MDTIEVRILLFGKAREVAECHEIRRHLPKRLTSAELYDHIFEKILPALKTIRDSCILALDQRYCFERTAAGETETIILEANSEIAVIPPISGG
uniref:Molybdopterin synthase sulfur carrier subunit n=1 Tax=Globodera pallida TaxID=36090 RepID=A0A183CRY6_GLOPA